MYSEVDKLVSYVSRGIAPKYTEEMDASILVINQKCIRDFSLNFELARRHDLSKKKINELKILQNHDVVVNSTGVGTLGRVAQFNSLSVKASFDSHVTVLRPNEDKIDPIYFGYLIKSKQSTIESFAEGSTGQTELSKSAISSMGLKYIEGRKEQKLIANFLLSLDRKIALNKKMNATLEAMAQALFKSWFVDFDPVKAKLAAVRCGRDPEKAAMAAIACKLVVPPGKPKPDNLEEKLPSAEAIDAAIASLDALSEEQMQSLKEKAAHFPSDFIESELGLIPQGWKIRKFTDFLSFDIGGDWGKEIFDDKHTINAFIIRGTDFKGLKHSGSLKNIPKRWVELKKIKRRKIESGDILIEISGGSPTQSTGRSIYIKNEIIQLLDLDAEPASFCRLFRPLSKIYGIFISQHLDYIYEKGKMWSYQNQSTGISNFQTKRFLNEELVINPQERILEMYFSITDSMIETNLNKQINTLSQLRDALLPKLLSGEISVASD
jgi:type I restriction enzyme S subunit